MQKVAQWKLAASTLLFASHNNNNIVGEVGIYGGTAIQKTL